jgi:alpha-ketoglutarate-dependent taurine dioxygenase
MQVGQVYGSVGATLVDLLLSAPLSDDEQARIRGLLDEHGVLIMRDQELDETQLIAFSRRFGELATFHERDKRSATAAEIFRISNVEQDGQTLRASSDSVSNYFSKITRRWHTDGSYKAVPALATCLYGLEVPQHGGDTLFADMAAAYAQLPRAMKARLDGLHMVHNYENNMQLTPGHRPMSALDKAQLPPVTHPVVRHCAGGRKALYLSDNVARYVGGMTIEQGTALLQELLQWSTQPRFVYRHCWQSRDVLLWDNRRVMHLATEYDMQRYRRVMLRTEINGDAAVS